MKSFLLTSALSLGMLGGLSAQEAAPAQAPAAQETVNLNTLEPAVKKYIMQLAGTAMVEVGKLMGEGKQITPQAIAELTVEVIKNIPKNELPQEYQDYLENMLPLTTQMAKDAASIDTKDLVAAADLFKKLEEKYSADIESLNAKYPTAAKVLGNQDSIQELLIKEFGLQEKASNYIMENINEFAGDQTKMFSSLMQFMGTELLKEATK